MNMILSVFLCFAMIFSGTASLPATIENETVLTLSDLAVFVNDEYAVLEPDFVLATAASENGVSLRFEVQNGEETLMPVFGTLGTDGVRFALSDSGNAYYMSNETFNELLDLDEESTMVFGLLEGFFKDYGSLVGRTMSDPAAMEEYNRLSMDALIAATGAQGVDETVRLMGEQVTAQRYELEIDVSAAMTMLDELCSCGIAELESILKSLLAAGNSLSGTNYASYTEMFEQEGLTEGQEDISFPMVITHYMQDGKIYQEVEMSMDVGGQTMMLRETVVSDGDTTSMVLRSNSSMDYGYGLSTVQDMDVKLSLTGPMNAPEHVYCEFRITGDEVVEWTDSEGTLLSSETDNAFTGIVTCDNNDGLNNILADVYVTVNELDQYGEKTESQVKLTFGSVDSREADDSITAAVNLVVEDGTNEYRAAFNLNRAVKEAADTYAGVITHELGADTEGTAYNLMAADALILVSDAMLFSQDESVAALAELFAAPEEEPVLMEEGEIPEELSYNEYGDAVVHSFEEAAALYSGTLPSYTVPEQYALEKIEVSDYGVTVYYTSPEGSFYYMLYDYTSTEEWYVLDGGMQSRDGTAVKLYQADGMVYDATVYGDQEVTFYFEDMDFAEVEALLLAMGL